MQVLSHILDMEVVEGHRLDVFPGLGTRNHLDGSVQVILSDLDYVDLAYDQIFRFMVK